MHRRTYGFPPGNLVNIRKVVHTDFAKNLRSMNYERKLSSEDTPVFLKRPACLIKTDYYSSIFLYCIEEGIRSSSIVTDDVLLGEFHPHLVDSSAWAVQRYRLHNIFYNHLNTDVKQITGNKFNHEKIILNLILWNKEI